MGREVVGTQIQFRTGGEEDVSVCEDVAERDLPGIGEGSAVRPGARVVLGKEDLASGDVVKSVERAGLDRSSGTYSRPAQTARSTCSREIPRLLAGSFRSMIGRAKILPAVAVRIAAAGSKTLIVKGRSRP